MRGKENHSKVNPWKDKAKRHREEKEAVKRRIKELKKSRDGWKQKAQFFQAENVQLKRDMRWTGKSRVKTEEVRAKQHQFPVRVVMLVLWFRHQGNCSLRSCCQVLGVLNMVLHLELKVPHHSTIALWDKKIGHYRLHQSIAAGGEWVIILDESVSLGQQKLLLILGVQLGVYKFEKALSFEEVQLLSLGIGKSWKSKEIALLIEALKAKGCKIIYAVCDSGRNLLRALEISQISYIQDCTHALSLLIEKEYKDKEPFVSFSRRCVLLKRQVVLSKYAAIMPPTQRSKARFLNLDGLSQWAYKTLRLLAALRTKANQEELVEKIAWLEEYTLLIEQMYQVCQTMKKVFAILKNQGLSEQTAEDCMDLLEKSDAPEIFKEGIRTYLHRNRTILPDLEKVICCSDIIESFFGKFKNRTASNAQNAITDSCLSIPNYGLNFDLPSVKKALENVKIVDLKQWKKQNLKDSLIRQKRKMYADTG